MHGISTAFRSNNERYFRTRSMQLAVILLAQGFALVGLNRDDRKRHEFAFRKSFELEQTVERFNEKLPIYVEARQLIYAWKALREKMNANHQHGAGF